LSVSSHCSGLILRRLNLFATSYKICGSILRHASTIRTELTYDISACQIYGRDCLVWMR